MAAFDLLAFGLNALDRLIEIDRFPERGGKVPYRSERVLPGGQAAVAAVVCRRFGFTVSYAGSIGGDAAGALQLREFSAAGIDVSRLRRVPSAASQQAWVFVERGSGERTICYQRDRALVYPPAAVDAAWIASGRVLLVDGHDAAAAARAAALARRAGVRVVADLSNVHAGGRAATLRLLERVDDLVAAEAFPARLDPALRRAGPRAALLHLRRRFGIPLAALTLGAEGVLALDDDGWHYQPGFAIDAIDTTGAGDVFHGGYLVGLLSGWEVARRLAFAAALAALKCTAWGARGRIAGAGEVAALIAAARRNPARLRARPGLAAGGAR